MRIEILTGSGIVIHTDQAEPKQVAALDATLELLGGIVVQNEITADEASA